ncbi:MAG: hypothetical protein ACM3VW_00425, partial [Bacteroidota bacterium]
EIVTEKASEVGAKAKDAVSRHGDEDDLQPRTAETEAVVPVPEDNPAEEQMVAALEHDPSAEQIVAAETPAAEAPAESGACGCTEEKSEEA